MIAFLYDHGVTTRWHAEELDGLEHLGDHDPSYDSEIDSEDPLRLTVTVSLDDENLQLTFDESVTVVYEGPRGDEVAPANLRDHCEDEGLKTYEYAPSALEFAGRPPDE
jgi:hypothetical protein